MKFFLTTAVIAACMAVNVNGQERGFESDGYLYYVNYNSQNTVTFWGVNTDNLDPTDLLSIEIPQTVVSPNTGISYVVTRVGAVGYGTVLRGAAYFYSVVIPETVTGIEVGAFEHARKLTSVTFKGMYLKYIGSNAFYGCTSLTSILCEDSMLASITGMFLDKANMLPPLGLTEIQQSTFFGCSSLGNLVIPSCVRTIGFRAFEGCTSLTRLNLLSGLEGIGINAFYGCSSLQLVSIPNTVTGIGAGAFRMCSLKELRLDSNVLPLIYGNSSATQIMLKSEAQQCVLRPSCDISEADLLAAGWICPEVNPYACHPFILGKCIKSRNLAGKMFGGIITDAVPFVGMVYHAAKATGRLSVKAVNENTEDFQLIAMDTLDAEGNFRFENLSMPEGKYVFLVGAAGYESTPSAGIELTGDEGDGIESIGFVVDHEALTIRPYVAISGVSTGKPTLTLIVGASETLDATVTPADATDPAVTWSSSNPAAATVDEATGRVTAVAPGEAVITATAGSHTATCTVTVKSENITAAPELDAPDMKVYPNPFTGTVRLTAAEGCTLRVINTAGTTVHTQNIENTDETIRLEHFPAGVYFFHMEKDGQVKTVRVIKN